MTLYVRSVAQSLYGFLPADLHGQLISETYSRRTELFASDHVTRKGLTEAKYQGLVLGNT